jgi:hypothetical protein
MADISIQFHALPEELLAFVRQIVADFDLHTVALRFRPFDASALSKGRLDNCFSDESSYKRLHFTIGKPVLPAAHELDFSDKNPDSLRLDIGTLGEDGLRESWLSARTENLAAIATWKKIAKRLKSLTEQGATAVNPKTGRMGPAKSHRFTEGAKRLEATGIPMLTITGIVMKPGLPVIEKPSDAPN